MFRVFSLIAHLLLTSSILGSRVFAQGAEDPAAFVMEQNWQQVDYMSGDKPSVKLVIGARVLGKNEIDPLLQDCFQRQLTEIDSADEVLSALKINPFVLRLASSLQVGSDVTFKVFAGDFRNTITDISYEQEGQVSITSGSKGLLVVIKPRLTRTSCEVIPAAKLGEEAIAQAKITLQVRARMGLDRL